MSFTESLIMWVIRLRVVLLLLATCLNIELFPVRLAY